MPPPVILSIAGYDPSSGAGVTADVKTAAVLGCYAVTCITALTVQSSQGVFRVEPVSPEVVSQILSRLADDVEILAVRIGMLGSGAVAQAVRGFLDEAKPPHVVLDPVLRSSSGAALMDEAGLGVVRAMLPLCEVITPNIAEAAVLAGVEPIADGQSWERALPDARKMAASLHKLGARVVVITGGHLKPANDYVSISNPSEPQEVILPGDRIDSRSTHGTGCAFATALACRLALGEDIESAARAAKDYVRRSILSAYPLGKGAGPINHFA
jgi:hydroxymethylpyrimidine/phosphomethylpyrimidine kinase